ncbi:zinc finger protein 271 [Cottoperca gobio]|uniref:Zinc finger protein 271-like n=1 Tax=Cottoperca gobio TaxID=56716 RepID=A0A6J2RJ17_COTGO|nr:zinc finger protein 271-like [Cottoperca gobio]XP_029309978.1 zinc finger protein 271-like [Cottoperca gobio]XP_029309979.1 zinc finger protein 271-like [Cottoperca gobio]
MENCGFQSQLLSVMEVLAKAAVAEINRRVDDSCAVLRLEVSQSRRDIDLLKRKSEVMEAELRRTRMRARRKVFYPPAAERFSPLVKVWLNKERQSTDWDAEEQNQPQQCADVEPCNESEHILIKEERAEEDMWKNASEDKLISGAGQQPCFDASQCAHTDGFEERHHSAEDPHDPGALGSPTDGYDTFPEQQLSRQQTEAELVVKHESEEESDENAVPLDSPHEFVAEEGDGQLWSSSLCRDAVDPSFSYAEQQFELIPSVFPTHSGLHLEPQVHSGGKSHSVVVSAAARVKRRARTFGCKRPQPDEGHGALSHIVPMDQCSVPQQSQHQYRDSPQVRSPSEDSPAASSFCRSSFGLARRMRTPWRSGIGEKRFSCTYCDKSFMRFSQLKEHLRSHTGEKPFSCLQCGRSFTKQCNLIRHAVVHSGEKPFECSLCGKCFTQRSSLKSHQKTAH